MCDEKRKRLISYTREKNINGFRKKNKSDKSLETDKEIFLLKNVLETGLCEMTTVTTEAAKSTSVKTTSSSSETLNCAFLLFMISLLLLNQ